MPRYLLSDLLIHLDFLDEQIARQEAQIEQQLSRMPRYLEVVPLLDTIPDPGGDWRGHELLSLGSSPHRVRRSGPGPQRDGREAAGRADPPGKPQRGLRSKYLCSGLVLGAHGAARTRGSYLQSLYHRIVARRGKWRAAVAVGRTILQMAYYMTKRNQVYQELGATYLDALDKQRTAKRLIQRLEALGFEVHTTERAVAA